MVNLWYLVLVITIFRLLFGAKFPTNFILYEKLKYNFLFISTNENFSDFANFKLIYFIFIFIFVEF